MSGSLGELRARVSVTGVGSAKAGISQVGQAAKGTAKDLNQAAAAAHNTSNAFQQGQKASFGMAVNMKKVGLLAQQGSYGVQDFLVVLKDGGWQRGLMASSNNLAQMASLVNPMTGAIAGLGVTVLALLPMLLDFADAEEEASEKAEKLENAQRRLNDELQRRLKLHRDMVQLEGKVDAGKADDIKRSIVEKSGEVAGPLRAAAETSRAQAQAAMLGFLADQEDGRERHIKMGIGREIARRQGLTDIATDVPRDAIDTDFGKKESIRRMNERVRLADEALRSGSVTQMDMEAAIRLTAGKKHQGTVGQERVDEFRTLMAPINKTLAKHESALASATAELERFQDKLAEARLVEQNNKVESSASKAAAALEKIASTDSVKALEEIIAKSRKRVADTNDRRTAENELPVILGAQKKIEDLETAKREKLEARDAERVAKDRAAFKKKLEQKEIQSMGPVERLAAERDKMITEAKEAFSPKPTDTREQGFRNDADLLIAVDRINEIFSSKAKSLIKEIPKPKGMSGQSDLVSFTKQLQSNILGAGDIQKRQLAKQEDIAKTNKQAADLLKTIANSWKGGIPVAAS